ncbi:hypothetical protein ACE1TH_16190 [Shouchella sp. JSM 1781072]|uniref:hypothetical protein n=1 Tax=Bacillaceae TaxID=186817 RepID=UPI000C08C511|nr:hypothetical protein [Bacillus sp. Marseille-P3800]
MSFEIGMLFILVIFIVAVVIVLSGSKTQRKYVNRETIRFQEQVEKERQKELRNLDQIKELQRVIDAQQHDIEEKLKQRNRR